MTLEAWRHSRAGTNLPDVAADEIGGLLPPRDFRVCNGLRGFANSAVDAAKRGLGSRPVATMGRKYHSMAIRARCENGIFRPLEEVAIKEGTVVEVHVPAESESPRRRPSIKDLPFFGLWADRDDITDLRRFKALLRLRARL